MKRNNISYLVLLFISFRDYSYAGDHVVTQYFFSHGIADSHRQIQRYIKDPNKPHKPYTIDTPFVTFDYPDAKTSQARINRHVASLGQENEIIHLANKFFAHINHTDPVILVGVSRGASILVNFMALYKPNTIKALILESPFDSIDSIVTSLLHRAKLAWIPGAQKMGIALTCCIFKKYKANGIRPIESAYKLPNDIPILLICSLTDTVVPAWSTILLYNALKLAGNQHTHLLILPRGKHAELIMDPEYGALYQQVVHAFYHKYHLPHNEQCAQMGVAKLHHCQPSLSQLRLYFPDYIKI